jgi:hypothetical protein
MADSPPHSVRSKCEQYAAKSLSPEGTSRDSELPRLTLVVSKATDPVSGTHVRNVKVILCDQLSTNRVCDPSFFVSLLRIPVI